MNGTLSNANASAAHMFDTLSITIGSAHDQKQPGRPGATARIKAWTLVIRLQRAE